MGVRPPTALLFLGVACAERQVAGTKPVGLVGEGVLGLVEGGQGGCDEGPLVGIWGPHWGTDGMVPAEVERDDGGVVWLDFPLMTGLGEGTASLRLEGAEATLPLGARAGEHDLTLKQTALPDPDAVTRAMAANAAALDAEQVAWSQGSFLLMDGETRTGDVQLLGDRATIAVYDAFWLTPRPQEATVASDGPEIVLDFPVEPSLEGEPGRIRLNVPTWSAVIPAEREPTELDRRLRLVAGTVDETTRASLQLAAETLADGIEREETGALARRLAAEARAPDGGCLSLKDLDAEWNLLFRGYEVAIYPSPEKSSCLVELSPSVPQHGRHLRARFGPREIP